MTIADVASGLFANPNRVYVRAAHKDGVAPFTVTRMTKLIELDPEDFEADDWEEVKEAPHVR